eukprot:g45873.t1
MDKLTANPRAKTVRSDVSVRSVGVTADVRVEGSIGVDEVSVAVPGVEDIKGWLERGSMGIPLDPDGYNITCETCHARNTAFWGEIENNLDKSHSCPALTWPMPSERAILS